MKRVVVTGMGIVSPLGNTVPAFWENIKAGVCGIAPITRFDTAEYKVKVAAEVRDFNPRQYMEKLDVLHSDLYTQFAVGAACLFYYRAFPFPRAPRSVRGIPPTFGRDMLLNRKALY